MPRWWRLRVRLTVWCWSLFGREVGVCEDCEFHPWTICVLPRGGY